MSAVEAVSADVVGRAIEHVDDGVAVVDASGTILYATGRFASMFGYEPHELVGRPIEVLVPPDSAPDHAVARARFVHDGRSRPMAAPGYDIEGLRRDGTRVPVDVQLSPIADGLVLAAVRDATDARTRAAELALARADLASTRRSDAARGEALDVVVQHVFGAATQLHAVRHLAPDALGDDLDRCIAALHHALDVATTATSTSPARAGGQPAR